MHGYKDAVFSTLLGFALTSAVLLPPILSERSEKAARIAVLDAGIAESAVEFGSDRQARFARLLRNVDAGEHEAKGK